MTRSKHIYKKLNFSERSALQECLEQGTSQREASLLTGISRNSIRRELKRCSGKYNADEAQKHFEEVHSNKIERSLQYRNQVLKQIHDLESRIHYLESLFTAQKLA